MKIKTVLLILIIFLTLACNIGRSAPTQAPPLGSPSTVPASVETFTSTITIPTSTPEPLGIFTLSVLVDTTSELVTHEQAQTLVDESSQILYGLTGFVFEMIDFQELNTGGASRDMVQAYLNTPPAVIPNGIILFSFGDNGDAKLYGGYAYVYPGSEGFSNHFVALGAIARDLYVGVIHFEHRYAQCGYGDSPTPISDVGIAGECRGQANIACVEKYDYKMCSDAVDNLYASTPTYFSSSTFVHEIMHPFGELLNKDHYGTAECTEMMKKVNSNRLYVGDVLNFDLSEAQYYTNMCPYVFDKFIASYLP